MGAHHRFSASFSTGIPPREVGIPVTRLKTTNPSATSPSWTSTEYCTGGELNDGLRLGRHGRNVDGAGVEGPAVGLHRITEAERSGVHKVLPVAQGETGPVTGYCDAQRLDDLLEAQQAGPGLAVRMNQAGRDQAAVVNLLAEIPAIGIVLATARRAGSNAVLQPTRTRSRPSGAVLLEKLLVLAHAAGAVAHGVDVLAQHEWHRPAPGIQRGIFERRSPPRCPATT